jgi:ribosomal protein L37AE/L43A
MDKTSYMKVTCPFCGETNYPVPTSMDSLICQQCGKTLPIEYSMEQQQARQRKLRRKDEPKTASFNEDDSMTKSATVRMTDAWRLNKGDKVRGPNGETHELRRNFRPHETDPHSGYVDTDSGTALTERVKPVQVVDVNMQQKSLPGYGVPGGNSNRLPFDPQANHAIDVYKNQSGVAHTPGASNVAPGGKDSQTECPSCKKHGTLQRQGDHYQCSACGYREKFGGGAGLAFTDSPRRIITNPEVSKIHRSNLQYSTINSSGMSAIARRAQAVLAQEENS